MNDVTMFSLAQVSCVDVLKNQLKIKSRSCWKGILRNCIIATEFDAEDGSTPFDEDVEKCVLAIRSNKVILSLDKPTEIFVYDTLLAIL